MWWVPWLIAAVSFVVVWILIDIAQRRHAIIHNFPIIGHFRYWLEAIGPELRQYIVTSNNEELPFSRDQRSWIYASARKENDYSGFGTDNDLELELSPNHLIVRHAAFPLSGPKPGVDDHFGGMSARECFRYEADWGVPSQADRDDIVRLMSSEQRDLREPVAT